MKRLAGNARHVTGLLLLLLLLCVCCCSDGSLVRWLLEYETAGRRLIKSARFETYPAAA
jgi:hypothetical protein